MRRSVLMRLLLPAVVLAGCLVPASRAAGGDSAYVAEALGDGVHLFRPADDLRDRTNSLVVERADGLLVIDAQPTPDAARELLASIAKLSDAPVRYLVLSHSHVEATGGAAAFPDETLVIASHFTWLTLEQDGDLGAEMKLRSPDPASFKEPARRMPVLVVAATTRLEDARNPITLKPTQHAHVIGNMVVDVQDGQILYAGAVLFPEGTPYAADANITGWIRVLNSLVVQTPEAFVPLRGPAQTSKQIRAQRDALAWMRGQIEFGFVERKTSDEIPAFVLEAEKFTRYFSEEDPFLDTLIEKIVEETVGTRKERGLD